ncbi:hypothetical protein [Rhodococcus sp. IEGM 1379]|uniref:hypothetical protein n=1 Tax=Rhodococcus sp. IEGM 1379 TaxID=3047086 RepID=UPI0024B64498|nr:hypothetical protein [Rhodococcus sp. IEGM 1379]MDI9917861.1 hypothetical protein [Rhodococcus sp. IEGM 1379]
MSDDIGNQLPQPDPRGWLTFDHLPRDLADAEGSTQYADYEASKRIRGPRKRPATPAERTLLIHLGHEPPELLDTTVEYLTGTVRRRTWPVLELLESKKTQNPENQGARQ